mgnify:CR=1 FL=1
MTNFKTVFLLFTICFTNLHSRDSSIGIESCSLLDSRFSPCGAVEVFVNNNSGDTWVLTVQNAHLVCPPNTLGFFTISGGESTASSGMQLIDGTCKFRFIDPISEIHQTPCAPLSSEFRYKVAGINAQGCITNFNIEINP